MSIIKKETFSVETFSTKYNVVAEVTDNQELMLTQSDKSSPYCDIVILSKDKLYIVRDMINDILEGKK